MYGHQSRTCSVLTAMVDVLTITIETGESWSSTKDDIKQTIREHGISTTRKIATGIVNKLNFRNDYNDYILQKIKETRKTEFLCIFEDIYKACHPTNTVDVNSDDFDIYEYSDMLTAENAELCDKINKKCVKMVMTRKENNWMNTDVCGICLDEKPSNSSVALGCNHGFCATCVSELLKRDHVKCPNCRQEVSSISFCKTISAQNYNLIQDAIYS